MSCVDMEKWKQNTLDGKVYKLKRESALLGLILCYFSKNGNYKDLILYYGCVLQKLILLYWQYQQKRWILARWSDECSTENTINSDNRKDWKKSGIQ